MNAALVAPAATSTDGGTVSAALSLDTAIAKPPGPAGFVTETVQVAVSPDAMVAGAHTKPTRAGGVTTASEKAWEPPFSLAVKTAVVSSAALPTSAVKPAAAAPSATVIEPGTATLAWLLASATTAPPAGAAAVRLAVQELDPGAVTLAGTHSSALT
jgi:hypothetical protein